MKTLETKIMENETFISEMSNQYGDNWRECAELETEIQAVIDCCLMDSDNAYGLKVTQAESVLHKAGTTTMYGMEQYNHCTAFEIVDRMGIDAMNDYEAEITEYVFEDGSKLLFSENNVVAK